MSSILKALKKLEAEKTVVRPETVRIPIAQTARSTGRTLSYSITVVLLLACGVGLYRFYPRSPSRPQPTELAERPAAGAPEKHQQPVSSEIPVVRIDGDRVVAAETREVRRKVPTLPVPVSAATASRSRKPVDPMVQAAVPTTRRGNAVPTEPSPVLTSPPPPQERVTPGTRPVLKVEGIAFMDGVDSVAMINGIQASKSTVVEGARVEAVMRDRVLFSYMGERFEVMLGRSSRQ